MGSDGPTLPPYPAAGKVGKQPYVGREWLQPKRGGPGFYLVRIYAVPLMLACSTGRLEQEPCDNKVKPVEPAQMLGSFENQVGFFYGAAEHGERLHDATWGCAGTQARRS